MRTFLIILVAIIILGGGWYWYSSVQTPATVNVETTPASQNTNTSSQNPPAGQMEDGTIPESSGTNIDVNAGATVTTGAKSFTVTGSNFKFAPATMSVKKGDTVKITFVNSSGTHDFNIDEFNAHSGVISGGASKTVTFVADKAGSFEYYCSVGNHRAMGMKGTLTVTP